MNPPIQIRVLASGSTGNTSVVKFGQTRVLIDAGIPLKRIAAGLKDFGGGDAIDAVVLTHEHHDHVRGLDPFLRDHPNVPIFASAGTLNAMNLQAFDTRVLKPSATTALGPDLDVIGFRVAHDAAEVMGLRFEGLSHTACFVTDLGTWTENTVSALRGANTLILESNHDPELLRRGPYPVFLKRRISGARGHLSNDQARSLLERVAHPSLQRVVLAHLSETNNSPEIAKQTHEQFLAGSQVALDIASPDSPSPIWSPTAGVTRRQPVTQLTLF